MELISFVLWIFLLSNIWTNLFLGANLSELVGPNRTIIGMFANDIICIIPLSIVTAEFNLEAKAVTNAGQANLEFNSGNTFVERASNMLNPLCKSDQPRTPPRSPSKEVCNRRVDFTKI